MLEGEGPGALVLVVVVLFKQTFERSRGRSRIGEVIIDVDCWF